mmetsp:Transcript_70360/g.124256  ORF Transcript_70360/g.124256 Transcript_70360/m.124256 type:complete len:147 (+) Transcript_70360:104-544(+)|eukprot:CAMPEP_0197666286 /NCGR_PEP_ID=MMETSP1338-20131121/62132_1 /TAXON_ID=43686 ORGANISM="Pelagodinium beii, Strain RCC1491" /NCGR_SAMPLE_ID=MMETSP1338 /ASSEMBLY_ACC=CAM_ASM_000754 /LENGTH=146 /DNA_ID=CAMNT_0043245299 /DNA_START=18 /DNA_END=458 /DNA_ORIENTATION=-
MGGICSAEGTDGMVKVDNELAVSDSAATDLQPTESAVAVAGEGEAKLAESAPAAGAEPIVVTIRLIKGASSKWGLELEKGTKNIPPSIAAIRDGGVAQEYNKANPSAVIKLGDIIQSINGKKGNPNELVEIMQKENELEIGFLRQP